VENLRLPDDRGDAAASPSVSSYLLPAGRGRGRPIIGNSSAVGDVGAAGAAGFAASGSGTAASPAVAAAASSSSSSLAEDEEPGMLVD